MLRCRLKCPPNIALLRTKEALWSSTSEYSKSTAPPQVCATTQSQSVVDSELKELDFSWVRTALFSVNVALFVNSVEFSM